MGKRTSNVDYHETLMLMIREAVLTSLWIKLHGPLTPAGHGSNMPEVVREFWDAYGQEAAKMPARRPMQQAIDRWDLVIDAMTAAPFEKPVRDRLILWGRSMGKPWKEICRQTGIQRTTAWKAEAQALAAFGAYIAANRNIMAA